MCEIDHEASVCIQDGPSKFDLIMCVCVVLSGKDSQGEFDSLQFVPFSSGNYLSFSFAAAAREPLRRQNMIPVYSKKTEQCYITLMNDLALSDPTISFV